MNSFPALGELESRQDEFSETLIRWCNINSGTSHESGLRRMREALTREFDVLNAPCEEIAFEASEQVDDLGERRAFQSAPGIRLKKRADRERSVLLCIHMDTVYGEHDPFQACRWLDDGRLNGPGVADAKGGLLVLLQGLAAFEQSPRAERIGWEVLINSDEEIGSPGSATELKAAATRHTFGLLFEPTLADGTMVRQRKGSGNFTVIVRGVSAHAGREFDRGRNAIAELARVIDRLDQLNSQRDGVIVNVGKISGGGAVNVVPDLAIARINARVANVADGGWLESEFRNIIDAARDRTNAEGRGGFRFELHGGLTSPPKMPDARIHAMESWIESTGTRLGQSIAWKSTGGTCDGNKLFHYGLPNIDTLGVRGGNIHSADEFMIPESLVERAQLTALLLHRFANDELDMTAFRSLK